MECVLNPQSIVHPTQNVTFFVTVNGFGKLSSHPHVEVITMLSSCFAPMNMILWLYYSSFRIISIFSFIEESYLRYNHQPMDVSLRSLLHECSSRKMNTNALINQKNGTFLAMMSLILIENILT